MSIFIEHIDSTFERRIWRESLSMLDNNANHKRGIENNLLCKTFKTNIVGGVSTRPTRKGCQSCEGMRLQRSDTQLTLILIDAFVLSPFVYEEKNILGTLKKCLLWLLNKKVFMQNSCKHKQMHSNKYAKQWK
jgi:hypothetical protein